MEKMMSLAFRYRSETHYALIRTRRKESKKEHCVTIMNGALERMLFGHHIIVEEASALQPGSEIIGSETVAELKQCIMDALCDQLKLNKFAGAEL